MGFKINYKEIHFEFSVLGFVCTLKYFGISLLSAWSFMELFIPIPSMKNKLIITVCVEERNIFFLY